MFPVEVLKEINSAISIGDWNGAYNKSHYKEKFIQFISKTLNDVNTLKKLDKELKNNEEKRVSKHSIENLRIEFIRKEYKYNKKENSTYDETTLKTEVINFEISNYLGLNCIPVTIQSKKDNVLYKLYVNGFSDKNLHTEYPEVQLDTKTKLFLYLTQADNIMIKDKETNKNIIVGDNIIIHDNNYYIIDSGSSLGNCNSYSKYSDLKEYFTDKELSSITPKLRNKLVSLYDYKPIIDIITNLEEVSNAQKGDFRKRLFVLNQALSKIDYNQENHHLVTIEEKERLINISEKPNLIATKHLLPNIAEDKDKDKQNRKRKILENSDGEQKKRRPNNLSKTPNCSNNEVNSLLPKTPLQYSIVKDEDVFQEINDTELKLKQAIKRYKHEQQNTIKKNVI